MRVMINQHIPYDIMKQTNQSQGSSSSLSSSRNLKDQHDHYSSAIQSNHYYSRDQYDRGNSREYNDRGNSREYSNSYSYDRYNSYSHDRQDRGNFRSQYDSYSHSSKRQRL